MSDLINKARMTLVFSELNRLLAEDEEADVPAASVWFCAYDLIKRADEIKKCYTEEQRLALMN